MALSDKTIEALDELVETLSQDFEEKIGNSIPDIVGDDEDDLEEAYVHMLRSLGDLFKLIAEEEPE